jgi:aminoglycoside phosphotransferase (APT) family kinase protein
MRATAIETRHTAERHSEATETVQRYEPLRLALESALSRAGKLCGNVVQVDSPRILPRSSVYFLGDSADAGRCRWIVKASRSGTTQIDLVEARGALEQFSALERLDAYFQSLGQPFGVPTPVALFRSNDAFAYSYVPGVQLNRMLGARALVRPGRAIHAVSQAAALLAHLHRAAPSGTVTVDVRERANRILAFDAIGRMPASLRDRLERLAPHTLEAPLVRLHGDFAPVNVITDDTGRTITFDVDHNTCGVPEKDMARFLVMLQTDRLFIAAGGTPPVDRLRRRLERRFIAGYDGTRSPDVILDLEIIDQLLRRWATRRQLLIASDGNRIRRRTLDRSFAALLESYGRRLAQG